MTIIKDALRKKAPGVRIGKKDSGPSGGKDEGENLVGDQTIPRMSVRGEGTSLPRRKQDHRTAQKESSKFRRNDRGKAEEHRERHPKNPIC